MVKQIISPHFLINCYFLGLSLDFAWTVWLYPSTCNLQAERATVMNTKYPRQMRIIRNARKAMGYSQQQIATLIGVHIRQYQRIECGERDIRYASMKLGLSICAVLGIDPLVLVFGGEFKRMNLVDEEYFENTTGRTLLE